MQGFANKTIEAGAELWRLSREALAASSVATVISGAPLRRIVPLLGTTDDGRTFLRKLDGYLFEYGWRSGGFEYAQQGPHWHFQGDIKFEAFLAFGVKVLRGWAVDFRQEFAKTELGKLTGIRVIGTYGKLGPQLDGGPSWTWGPDIQALFDKFSGPMKTAAKTFPRNS